MTISVIGSGRWGTFLAWYLATHKKESVLLYGIDDDPGFQSLKNNRRNDFLEIPDNIALTTDLAETLKNDYIVISIGAQNLKHLVAEMKNYNIKGKTFILAMKGIDIEGKKRLSEIMPMDVEVAVLLGPGHVQDYLRGVSNCAVIDGRNQETKQKVVALMGSKLIRLYYGVDLIGNEIGGAYKNVIGIAAGILDGLGWNSLKGALMARSIVEVGRFIKHYGGNPQSASGLAFLGDFEATLFSPYSNNRMFGEKFVKNESFEKNSEGYYTLEAVKQMGESSNLELPITYTLHDIIYKKTDIKDSIDKLFARDLKKEF
jgi:glycerol-3-phosphate dehydrogenase (NAD(P)+)